LFGVIGKNNNRQIKKGGNIMRNQKSLLALVLVIVLITTGCSNGSEKKEQKTMVQVRVGDKDKFDNLRKVTDSKLVSKTFEILDKTHWKNAEVSMTHPAIYKFRFENINNKIKSDVVIYSLWISPHKDKIELVMEGKGKYVQLDKSKSAELFKIITGEKLG
jgi:hypothetical protein